MLRIGDRNDERAETGRLRGREGARGGLERGTGCGHIINENDVSAGDALRLDQRECPSQVFLPLLLRVQVRLRFRVAQSNEHVGQADPASTRDPPRDQLRLVVSARDLPPWVQWNRDDRVRVLKYSPDALGRDDAIGKELRDWPAGDTSFGESVP